MKDMGNAYSWGYNPFRDLLFQSIMYDNDISEINLKPDIYAAFANILEDILNDQNDVKYLDFDIVKRDGYFKLIGNNPISAMWMICVFPKDIKAVLKTNEFKLDNITYKYNPKTRTLTNKIKNG